MARAIRTGLTRLHPIAQAVWPRRNDGEESLRYRLSSSSHGEFHREGQAHATQADDADADGGGVEGQWHGRATGDDVDQFPEKSLNKTTLPWPVAFAK